MAVVPDCMALVERPDPALWDYSVSDFVTDGTWHDISFSPIVPAGVVAVLLRIQFKDNTVGAKVVFKKKDQVNGINAVVVKIEKANVQRDVDRVAFVDHNQMAEYLVTNTIITELDVSIRAWFTEAIPVNFSLPIRCRCIVEGNGKFSSQVWPSKVAIHPHVGDHMISVDGIELKIKRISNTMDGDNPLLLIALCK